MKGDGHADGHADGKVDGHAAGHGAVLGGRVLDRNKLFSLEWEELGELVVSPVLTLWSLFSVNTVSHPGTSLP